MRMIVAMLFKFPEGLILRTTKGGASALKAILLDLKKYSFNGYVKTVMTHPGQSSTGFIVLKDGYPLISVYRMAESEQTGRAALTKIWKESHSERCSIEIHTRVDVDRLIVRFSEEIREQRKAIPAETRDERMPIVEERARSAEARLPAPGEEARPPGPSGELPPPELQEKAPPPPLEAAAAPQAPAKAEQEAPGKEAKPEVSVPKPPPEAEEGPKEAVPEPEEESLPVPERMEGGRRGEEPEPVGLYKKELEGYRSRGYRVDSLEKALERSPANARAEFARFEESIKKIEILKSILASLKTVGFEERVGKIKEMLADPDLITAVEAEIESLRVDMGKKSREVPLRPRKKDEHIPLSARDRETNLIIQYTFDNFVVGQSNRLAWGAAFSIARTMIAKGPTMYNPLFIWSGPGLGKTHLLNAVGNYILSRNKDIGLLYTSAEKVASEFSEAAGNDTLKELREKYRELDVLLIDDIQFLSGNEGAQDELFHAFNALYSKNKQIVLASDRLPKEIPQLQDRLVSRFESGLVADIQIPEFETRFSILFKRCEANNVTVDKSVLELIAKVVVDNIRELEGAFNKVVAYSTLMGKPLNVESAKEALKDMIKEDIKVEAKKVSKGLSAGGSYLVEEEKPDKCFEIFLKMSKEGYEPLMITRYNPKRIRDRFKLEKSRILWLTDKESDVEETVHPGLEQLASIIETCLKGKKGIVLLDGLEYLISMNNFDSVLRFIRSIIDQVSESESAFLLSVSPKTMKEWEIKIIEKEMEVLELA